MVRLRSIGLVGLTLLAILTRTAWAETLRIPAGESLIDALARAQPGDTLLLGPGSHAGPVLITVPGITLEGESGAVIDGGGSGDSIHVSAADVTLRHLTVRHSGQVLIDKNSGIFLDRDADRARVEDCDLIDNLIAVYLDGPQGRDRSEQPHHRPAPAPSHRARTGRLPVEHSWFAHRG